MAIMDIAVAKSIVRQFYQSAVDPALENILTLSKASDYRPYYTASFFIFAEYRQLTRADEVNFSYDKLNAIKGLITMQCSIDTTLIGIPPGFTCEEMLAQLDDDIYSPGSFMVSGMNGFCEPISNAYQGW